MSENAQFIEINEHFERVFNDGFSSAIVILISHIVIT